MLPSKQKIQAIKKVMAPVKNVAKGAIKATPVGNAMKILSKMKNKSSFGATSDNESKLINKTRRTSNGYMRR